MVREQKILASAKFDPKLKVYIFLNTCLILAITCVGIPLLIPWAIFGMAYVNKYYNSLKCYLTQRELVVKKGVWFRQEKTIPLEKITDLAMHEGPIQRYFGLCALKVETAGSSAPQGAADAGLVGIMEPQDFRDQVLDQRDLHGVGGKQTEVQAASIPRVESDPEALNANAEVLIEIRDTLKRIENKMSSRWGMK